MNYALKPEMGLQPAHLPIVWRNVDLTYFLVKLNWRTKSLGSLQDQLLACAAKSVIRANAIFLHLEPSHVICCFQKLVWNYGINTGAY